jgi:predicted ArsR family transcriptional regulator
MATPDFFPIESLDQLRALQSPRRVQLVAVIRHLGEASVREIAEQMETRAEGLHYHLRELVQVGLVERCGKRMVRRRMESVYRLPGCDLKIDPDGREAEYLTEVAKVYGAALRLADRTMVRALEHRSSAGESTAEAPRLIQMSSRLGRKAIKELACKILELEEFLREHHDPTAPDAYLLTVAYSENPSNQQESVKR